MKVCLLGPITTKSYYGGVAVFDEELAKGFVDCGWEAVFATTQKDAEEKDIPLRIVSKTNFEKFLEREKPDFVISSLAYAKVLPKNNHVKTAYFLHGFFLQSYYGAIKSVFATSYQKMLIKKCDFVFANSYFTRMANKEFFKIKTDAVFHLGVSQKFLRASDKIQGIERLQNSVFFAGRLVSVKGVEVIVKAAHYLKQKNIPYTMYLAGDGPDKEKISKYIAANQLNVTLLGRLNYEQMCEWYHKTEVFVSLNPSEPFGIVFPEALVSGCKIVCPLTGGQVEYLKDYSDTVSFVNEANPESVAEGIETMFEHGIPARNIDECKRRFNYKRVATEIIEYIGENKNE